MHISPDDVEKSVAHYSKPRAHLHSKGGTLSASRQREDPHCHHAIVDALAGARQILIVGPTQAQPQLVKHTHAHGHAMVPRAAGVETVDHPSDGQLDARASKYFVAKDRMPTPP